MKGKVLILMIILVTSVVLLSGCRSSEKNPETITFSSSLNFHKDEYEEKYSQYEKILEVSDNSSKIIIEGTTSSGKIDVTIVGEGEKTEESSYVIDGVFKEELLLDKENALNWKAIIKCYADTEGDVTISVACE